jgi:hypothetical protein
MSAGVDSRWALTPEGVARHEARLGEKDAEAYDFVLSDRRGRWLLARLARENFRDGTTFADGAGAQFNEGRRAAVLMLFQRMRAARERFGQLLLLAEAELWAEVEEGIREAQKEEDGNGR